MKYQGEHLPVTVFDQGCTNKMTGVYFHRQRIAGGMSVNCTPPPLINKDTRQNTDIAQDQQALVYFHHEQRRHFSNLKIDVRSYIDEILYSLP